MTYFSTNNGIYLFRSVFGSTSNRSQRSRSKKSSIESSGDIAEAVAEISTGFAGELLWFDQFVYEAYDYWTYLLNL